MPRRRFRFDAKLDRMVEVDLHDGQEIDAPAVRDDIEPFVSILDKKTVIKSRSHMRDYMAEHDVVHYDDAKTQKAEADRYEPARQEKAMRERLYEYVDRLVRTGRGPNG